MHTKILQRCGWVLVTVGVLDIGYMIWCITHHAGYSSSLNVFAVVGGILLARGGLKTARWVASLTTFMLAAMGIGLLTVPWLYPLEYWLAVMRHGSDFAVGLVVAVVFLALLSWVRQQVMHPAVQQALLAANLPPPRIKAPLACGVALPVLLLTLVGVGFHGDNAQEAIRRVKQQLGGNYHYVITTLQFSSDSSGQNVFAVVTAYNDAEIKDIEVSWRK